MIPPAWYFFYLKQKQRINHDTIFRLNYISTFSQMESIQQKQREPVSMKTDLESEGALKSIKSFTLSQEGSAALK